MNADLVVALPSKGALQASTMALLERCFLSVSGDGGGRSYNARIKGIPGAAVLYARADEIPQIVRSGRAHVGITGLDLYRESQDGESGRVQLLLDDLGYGSANLEVGVPKVWIDVADLADLIEVAHDIRHRHARPLLVATKFPNLTRRHFISHGFSDFRLVQSLGATEAAPRSGLADIVVDLVSSGATFTANGLTTIEGGLVLRSQACLVASGNTGAWSTSALGQFRHMAELVDAALRAQRRRSLRATFASPPTLGPAGALSAPHLTAAPPAAPTSTPAAPTPAAGVNGQLPVELSGLLSDVKLYRLESGQGELTASFDRRDVHQVLGLVRSAGATQAEVIECEIMASYGAPWIESFATGLRPVGPRGRADDATSPANSADSADSDGEPLGDDVAAVEAGHQPDRA